MEPLAKYTQALPVTTLLPLNARGTKRKKKKNKLHADVL